MLDLPNIGIEDLPGYADWLELNALVDGDAHYSREWVRDMLHSSGLLGNTEEPGIPEDDVYRDEIDLTDYDGLERFTEDLWAVLEERSRYFGEMCPYRLDGNKIESKHSCWHGRAAYVLLLLNDLLPRYGATVDEKSLRRLFEKVVQASLSGLLGGTSVRFGWPREPDWPTSIEDRLATLGDLMELQIENLDGKTDPTDKDRGLDVVARQRLGDQFDATVTYLVQCATGKFWKSKAGEPSITNWQDLFVWKSLLVRVLAVPWTLSGRDTYVRMFRHFDSAIILDRPRLASGQPDEYLAEDTQKEIVAWCHANIQSIPRVD